MSAVPMTTAALPPRVSRPSTAPSVQKPRMQPQQQTTTMSAAANQQRHHANVSMVPPIGSSAPAPALLTSTAKPRPSSAAVVTQRPIGPRPTSATASRPQSGGVVRGGAITFGSSSSVVAATSAGGGGVPPPPPSTSRTSAVASVKGDILLLQRTIDKLCPAGATKQTRSSLAFPQRDGLFEVEQILAHEFPPVLPGDDATAADMHAKLLELFVQRLNTGALQTLRRLDEDAAENISLISRTAAINALLAKVSSPDFFYAKGMGSADDNDGNAADDQSTSRRSDSKKRRQPVHVQTQTHTIGGLSADEVTDFQVLLKEQRDIQSEMRKTLAPPSSSSPATAAPVPATSTSSSAKSERAQVRALKADLEEANKTIASLNLELASMQSKFTKSESARLAAQQQQKAASQQSEKTGGGGAAAAAASSLTHAASGHHHAMDSMRGEQQQHGGAASSSSMRDGAGSSNNTSGRRGDFLDASASDLGGRSGGENSTMLHHQHHQHTSPESAIAAAMAGSVGFYRLDPDVLAEVGLDEILDAPGRFMPDRQYCELVSQKVSGVVSEVLQQINDENEKSNNASTNAGGSSLRNAAASMMTAAGSASVRKGGKRSEKENSPEALNAKIGSMWWVLEKQNATVQAMQLLLAKQHDELKQAEAAHDALDKRSKRMISVLEEKLGHAKSVVQRLMEENEILNANAGGGGHDGDSRSSSRLTPDGGFGSSSGVDGGGRSSQNSRWGPNVRSPLDDPTSEESRKMYERNEIRLQRRLLELEHEHSQSQNYVEQAKLGASAAHRELQMLKARTAALEKELKTSKETEKAAVAEAAKLREDREVSKKDFREKSITATEAQQKVNRLEVELHITQNIVEELRRRELDLDKSAADSKQCQNILRSKVHSERDSHTREMARLKEENRAAKHEVIVANQILADERQKGLANEREIERLRGLDLQLEALQQNFANYAGAKQAQKEAHEEEERALQACVDLIGQDVFALPFNADQGEAEVELLLRRLLDAEESMAQEERTRDTLRSTVVGFRDERSGRKQLATLMQRRYNAIQIFACQQRLKQLRLERQLQDTIVENDEHRVQYEGAMVELSHARSHEQALLQRNSELEQQRRENIKTREQAETDVKTLRQTIQRMRIANEEQEAAVVDLGTKLKRAELAAIQPSNNPAASLNSTMSGTVGSLAGSLRTKGPHSPH